MLNAGALITKAMEVIIKSDPAAAMNMVSQFSNAETQQNLQQQVASNWMRSDRAAATAWVQSSNLSEQAKTAILNQH